MHAFYPREWSLGWEGIDHRPVRDPATSRGASLLAPMRLAYEELKPKSPQNKGKQSKRAVDPWNAPQS